MSRTKRNLNYVLPFLSPNMAYEAVSS